MNEVVRKFRHEMFGELNVFVIDGEPWFLGKEIAEKLNYKNTRKAVLDHVDTEDRGSVTFRDGTDGNPNKVVINESGNTMMAKCGGVALEVRADGSGATAYTNMEV